MREHGTVTAQKVGRQVFYSLASPLVESVLEPIRSHVEITPEKPISCTEMSDWQDRYMTVILAGDQKAARQVVSECLERGLPMPDLFVDIFQAALEHIGKGYEAGRLTEAQEHLATSMTERLIAVASQFYPASAPNGLRAVLGACAGNRHVVGLRMIADVMQHAGWHALYLGADVPTESFAGIVEATRPDAVMISCAIEEDVREAIRLAGRLRVLRESGDLAFKIGIGGRYMEKHPQFITQAGADFTACDLRDLMAVLNLCFPPGTTLYSPR
jgi:methanogenic corrinoid protein MtbC1